MFGFDKDVTEKVESCFQLLDKIVHEEDGTPRARCDVRDLADFTYEMRR